MIGRTTLTRYTIEQQHQHPEATGDFSALLHSVATSAKLISNRVRLGELASSLGTPVDGGTRLNATGDMPKELDLISNDIVISETEWGGHLTGMVSEELDDVLPIPNTFKRGKYLLVFDPLDGSSNIDVNISVGTIFSILRSPHPGEVATTEDFLQPGTEQVCAGFALYGPSTMLVLTTGNGVDGFTLDSDVGEFVLTHPGMRVPESTSEFAINASNERFWEVPIKRYVSELLAGSAGPRERDFNMRWIASLVAETYRILTRGGVFLYPRDTKNPTVKGRLRLLYEANPVAYLIEQAGGAASTGNGRMLQVQPTDIHERVPFIFGSRDEVERIEQYHAQATSGPRYDSSLFNTRSLFRS
ncbi:MAG: class 1 fructose-bisphosphatase [Propionibacteriaceae bacterium]|nr:class 1 fructose-bisphosphatase [Propionibacteriaceae bacterium]